MQVTLLWGVNKDMDLFETVRDQLGCEYISDMRSCRALLNDAKKVVASLDLEAYTAIMYNKLRKLKRAKRRHSLQALVE